MKAEIKQSNHHFFAVVKVNKPIDQVWSALTDSGSWHKWDTELKSAKIEGEMKEGAQGTLKPKTGPELSFKIKNFRPLDSYDLFVKMPVGSMVISRSLQEKDGSVEFRDEIKLVGPLRKMFGLFLGRSFRKVLPEVMKNFKNLVENDADLN